MMLKVESTRAALVPISVAVEHSLDQPGVEEAQRDGLHVRLYKAGTEAEDEASFGEWYDAMMIHLARIYRDDEGGETICTRDEPVLNRLGDADAVAALLRWRGERGDG